MDMGVDWTDQVLRRALNAVLLVAGPSHKRVFGTAMSTTRT
jgi:hypothetical protein